MADLLPAPSTPARASRARRRHPHRIAAAGLAVAVALAGVACSRDDSTNTLAKPIGTNTTVPGTTPETFALPEGSAVPTVPVAEVTFPASPFLTVTPKAQGPLQVYASPDGAPQQTLPNPRMVGTPPAAVPLVLLVKDQPSPNWYQVYLPVRPNGSTGFVKAADVTTASHDYRIEVHLSSFNLKAFKGEQVILDAPIAVASEASPTPGGIYFTTELIRPTEPNGPYGSYAYGLSGFSETYESFGGGEGQLGIHGTNEPEKMGQKVSHGCIRLRNQDIEQLAKVLPLGVPVGVYT